MPALREQDFDKLATRVVDRYLSGQAKLADAAAEEATANGLNPDQIERLTQAANTQTFLRMMEDRKAQGQGDLMHEFDPIDARHVIRIVIDNAGVHVNPPEEMGGMGDMTDAPHGYGDSPPEAMPPDENEIPDEMGAAPDGPPPGVPGEKSKAPPFAKKEKVDKDDGDDDKDDKPKKKPSDKEAAFRVMRLRKMAGLLQDQFHQTEWAFEEKLAQLTERFRRVYNPVTYEAFEKDALAEHGTSTGLAVLNSIRNQRSLDALNADTVFAKVAADADHHVSDDTLELHLFDECVKLAEDALKIQRGLEWVRAQCA